MEGNCPAFPSPRGKTTIHIKMYMTRHTNGGSIPMYQSTIAQEAHKGHAIHMMYQGT